MAVVGGVVPLFLLGVETCGASVVEVVLSITVATVPGSVVVELVVEDSVGVDSTGTLLDEDEVVESIGMVVVVVVVVVSTIDVEVVTGELVVVVSIGCGQLTLTVKPPDETSPDPKIKYNETVSLRITSPDPEMGFGLPLPSILSIVIESPPDDTRKSLFG